MSDDSETYPLWIPDLKPGDVVERQRNPGVRILIQSVYPKSFWFGAVEATKSNRPDRRFRGWSSGDHNDRFRLLFRPACPRQWYHGEWHRTRLREWDGGACWEPLPNASGPEHPKASGPL